MNERRPHESARESDREVARCLLVPEVEFSMSECSSAHCVPRHQRRRTGAATSAENGRSRERKVVP